MKKIDWHPPRLIWHCGTIKFQTQQKLRKELSTFCDDDYLLLIGDPAIIALAGAVVSEMNRGKFKVLKWDRDEKRYYDIEIDLKG